MVTEDGGLVDVYTVEDAIDTMGCGVFQVFLSLFAGGMWVSDCILYGYMPCEYVAWNSLHGLINVQSCMLASVLSFIWDKNLSQATHMRILY